MERFWSKVAKGAGDECWQWTAACTKRGYGHIRMGSPSKLRAAHRVAYELVVGPIPAGLELDHTCCNLGCVNPSHLEAVTHLENIRRWAQRRDPKTTCKFGHPLTGENLMIVGREQKRRCRICGNRRSREWLANHPKPPKGRTLRTHCKKGHLFTDETTAYEANGTRKCRICRNRRAREYAARKAISHNA